MKLTRSTLRTSVDGRWVTVQGEAYLRGFNSPDFVAYANSIVYWDDGALVTPSEREEIISQIKEESSQEGIDIEVE